MAVTVTRQEARYIGRALLRLAEAERMERGSRHSDEWPAFDRKIAQYRKAAKEMQHRATQDARAYGRELRNYDVDRSRDLVTGKVVDQYA